MRKTQMWRQAWAFGTTFLYMRQVKSLASNDSHHQLQLVRRQRSDLAAGSSSVV